MNLKIIKWIFKILNEWDKNNRLREITKQNRTIIAENEDLRFSLEKSEKKLSTLSKEYDKLAIELTNARSGYQSQTESLSSFREEIQRKAENSSKNAQISDRELNILREEYRTIKSAYDKIIARSLQEENNGKKTLDELSRLRSELQQINSDSESERNQFKQKINKLKLQNEQLEKELIEKEKNYFDNNNKIKNNYLIENEKKQMEKQNNNINDNDDEEEKEENANKLTTKKPTTTTNKENTLLDKLFSDVLSIVEKDVKLIGNKNKIINNVNENEINEINNFRWQKMYEDVYEELEKVRQILLAEHELNNRLREELNQKKIENEDLQAKYENKLKELESELNKRNIQTNGIERALQSIANGNQILNNNLIFKNIENNKNNLQQIESTELSLTFSKLILTENCLKFAESQNPAVFVAIEFFDFELQTSQLVNGPEANLNFTSIFELTISDLFIHYLQTEGMNIELYIVQNEINYKLCSQATIPLKKLLSIKTQTNFR
uniref:RPGR-interacting protein 1 first C2 domain-containing protein n=1 Tax=Meloidogyne enterolobii TaxID=390850 RepID=A0A6V7X7U5_MELEN|nr:unnamed protein product [Meloidogyne enterolobii]